MLAGLSVTEVPWAQSGSALDQCGLVVLPATATAGLAVMRASVVAAPASAGCSAAAEVADPAPVDMGLHTGAALGDAPDTAPGNSPAPRDTERAEPAEEAPVESHCAAQHVRTVVLHTTSEAAGVGSSSPVAWSWHAEVSCTLSAHASPL